MDHSSLGAKFQALNLKQHSCQNAGSLADAESVADGNSQYVKCCSQENCLLTEILKQHECERNDTLFSRSCLFCKKHFTGNRTSLFQHLREDHNFHVGSPANIVYANDLLDTLSEMLKNLQCFYCEKFFKDWTALKEHMRKKQHKRINPNNKSFDKYYLINYLEPGKNWTELQNEEELSSEFDEEQEGDLMECGDECWFLCLFCTEKFKDLAGTLSHMNIVHRFDYEIVKLQNNLNFYQQVKFINYVRRQMDRSTCIFCEETFCSREDVLQHMNLTGHLMNMPDSGRWDQAMFYFPTLENDSFLCALDDGQVEKTSMSSEPVIVPEELQHPQLYETSLLNDPDLRKSLM